MTIAFGTAGTVASGTTGALVPYPSSIAAGDLLLLTAVAKYSVFTSAPPTGFTLLRERVAGSGGTGVDAGNVRTAVWYRIADGTEPGAVSVTKATETGTVILARMFRYARTAGYGWSILSTDGQSNTGAASWNAITSNNVYIADGDVVVAVSGANTDAPEFSAQSLTAAGATLSLTSELQDSGTTNGHDVRLVVTEHACTAGESTAAPTYTGTASTGTPDGGTIVVRLRESLGVVADQGGYTLGGQDATFLRGIRMVADAGYYTRTGYDATFSSGTSEARSWFQTAWAENSWVNASWYAPTPGGFPMLADQGAYALTGQDASLRAGYKLTAEYGTYALTGQDAGIGTGYRMAAEVGSHAVTPQDFASARTYVFTCAQGSHTTTLQNVIHYLGATTGNAWLPGAWYENAWEGTVWADNSGAPGAYFLGAQTGRYSTAATGGKAWFESAWVDGAWGDGAWSQGQITTNLYKGYTLTADTGYYVYTGDDALRDMLAVPQSGSYALTGQDIAGVPGAYIAADVGGYVLSGQAATFLRGYRMTAQFGGYSTGGSDVTFEVGVGLAANQGSYALTGQPATFTIGRGLEAAVGSYTLNGQDVRLVQGDLVNLEGGSYTLTGQDAVLFKGYRLSADTGYYTAGGQLVSPVPVSTQRGAGKSKRKKYEKKYVVEVDGNEFVVETKEEAEELLAQAKQVAEELLADAQAAAEKKKTALRTPKAPKIRVRGPVGDELNELVSVVSEGREAIRDLFEAMRDQEIAYLIRKSEEDDEEDAITALLMN